jgi:hypothetical protein
MAGHGEKLERRQEVAIACLLSEPTVEEAAKKARVAYSTLKGWLQQPDFQAAYRAARAEVLDRTVARLLATCAKAVGRLEANLDSANPQAANRAAALVLAHAIRGVELMDLRAEVDELRRQFEAMKKGDSDAEPEARGREAEAADGPAGAEHDRPDGGDDGEPLEG